MERRPRPRPSWSSAGGRGWRYDDDAGPPLHLAARVHLCPDHLAANDLHDGEGARQMEDEQEQAVDNPEVIFQPVDILNLGGEVEDEDYAELMSLSST